MTRRRPEPRSRLVRPRRPLRGRGGRGRRPRGLVVGAGGQVVARLTYAELDGRAQRVPPRPGVARGGTRGPGGPAPAQPRRARRGHARRVQAPGGAGQRELPVHARGAGLRRHRQRPGGGGHRARPGRVAEKAARLAGGPQLAVVVGRRQYEAAAGGRRRARRPVGPRSGDDLYVLYTGGHDRVAEGRHVAPARHLHRRLRGRGTPSRASPRPPGRPTWSSGPWPVRR